MRPECVSAWIVGGVILAFLAGCASRSSVREVESELARVSSHIEELRKLNDSTVRELARTVAELKELHAGAAKLAREEQERTQQLSRVEARLADAEGTLRGLRVSVAELSREVGQLAIRQPAWEPTPRGRPARSGSPDQLYAAALAQMRAGEHGQAVLDFLDFIAKFPAHPLAGHAQYWIGEAYYLQRDFRQALAEFQKLLPQHGKGPMAAEALLKIGLCYQAVHEPIQARAAWDRLIEEFPRSEAARKARILMRARPASAMRSR